MDWFWAINAMVLFFCVSLYLGTGWSLVLFSFPVADDLTVDNYYTHIVPQVFAATRFFTGLTWVMSATVILMVVGDWGEWTIVFPIVVLVAFVAALVLTARVLLPANRRMRDGITDPAELEAILDRWKRFNLVRTSLWTAEWLAMATWFVVKVAR